MGDKPKYNTATGMPLYGSTGKPSSTCNTSPPPNYVCGDPHPDYMEVCIDGFNPNVWNAETEACEIEIDPCSEEPAVHPFSYLNGNCYLLPRNGPATTTNSYTLSVDVPLPCFPDHTINLNVTLVDVEPGVCQIQFSFLDGPAYTAAIADLPKTFNLTSHTRTPCGPYSESPTATVSYPA
jgi:hypothetical protein